MNLMESLLANKLAARQSSGGSDLTPEVKEALLDCFAHVAWAVEDGQQYYDALADALYGLQSISAVYTQSGTVYDTDSLDSLKADLVVTALYGDGSTQTVPAESYTLSGTLTEGTSTITVSYGGKTATFDVTVTRRILPVEYQQAEYISGDGSAYFGISMNVPLGYTGHAIAEQAGVDTSKNRVVFGTANAASYVSFGTFFSDGTVGAYYGGYQNKLTLNDVYGIPLDFTAKCVTGEIDCTVKSNTEQQSGTKAVNNIAAGNNFNVFYNGVATAAFIGKIYFAELLDTNNNAVIQLYPCVRLSDNVAGMYDVVGNTFYSSATSTPFVAGPAA